MIINRLHIPFFQIGHLGGRLTNLI